MLKVVTPSSEIKCGVMVDMEICKSQRGSQRLRWRGPYITMTIALFGCITCYVLPTTGARVDDMKER